MEKMLEKLISYDLELSGIITWEEEMLSLFKRYDVDNFMDLAYFTTEEDLVETLMLGEALMILNK